MSDVISLDEDLRAIAALNNRDVEFALAGDPTAMMSQWTDDIVLLQPAGPIVRGRSTASDALLAAASAIEILEWVFDFQEIKVFGDHAIEWGTYRGRMRSRAGGDAFPTAGKLLRVLQRQLDGSWKIHRTITTS